MTPEEFRGLDATAQAELVRHRAVHPRELLAAAGIAIDTLNPTLNAIIHPRLAAARAECEGRLPAGPFRGVPFLVKDLGCAMAGEPYYCGSRYLRDAALTAAQDSWLAARYRAAGFVILGRTNTPEFGIVTTTEPLSYGATRNPWDLARSPGGSSGGSAAAIASGMAAAAHGNDGGGSIRVPAGHCGLFGLKPSRGRVSHAPDRGETWLGAACDHALTHSVRDSAAILDATAVPAPGDPYLAPPPPRPFAEALQSDPPRYRIGLMNVALPGQELHPDCRAAVGSAATLLEDLGHHVEIAHPKALEELDEEHHFMRIVASWVVHDVRELAARIGRPPAPGELEPATDVVYAMGLKLGAADYLAAQVHLQRWARRVAAWWTEEGFDFLLTPTASRPAQVLGTSLATSEDPLKPLRATVPYIGYTSPFNVTGQPAASLPLHWTAGDLPIGVQLVAPYGEELSLLALAAELERARPWQHRRPSPLRAALRAAP
ncbi:MAG: amidase [Gammaproteobacteria bacterium]|nr:amidase [Gammaproteobacteria bacterium]